MRELLSNKAKSLSLTLTQSKSTIASSTLGDDISELKSLCLEIRTCRENLDKSRLHLQEKYNIDNYRPVDSLRVPSTIFALRRKLVAFLRQSRPGLPGNATRGNGKHPVLGTPSTVRIPPSSFDPSTTSRLLQLPTELKLHVLDMLNTICQNELHCGQNSLLALRL